MRRLKAAQKEKMPYWKRASASHRQPFLFGEIREKIHGSGTMGEDILKEAALAFQALLYVEYHIVLGRKMQTRELHLCFLPDNFYHLAGLHKLRDPYPFRFLAHKKVFRQILSGKIYFEMIRSDAAVPQLIPRMKALREIERVLDAEETTFFQYGGFSCNVNDNG